MIEVAGLVKRFGDKTAVAGVSFSARRGEVLGVLGPNGAGKTTTLRMLCGYLPPTAGTALIDGIDVWRDSLAARRRLGYLPESVPLYPEMRVREYLEFRSAIKGVSRKHRAGTIARAVELCTLADRMDQTVGTLSKGFRQRVGLADALLGAPPLLVLDEPTVGLDPNQVIQTRSLIQQLRGEHTILLSSHILSEVEQVCDRVVIFRQGHVIAEDTPAGLQSRAQLSPTVTIEVPATAGNQVAALIDGLASLVDTTALDDGWLSLTLQADNDPREALFERASANGIVLRELTRRSHSLEEVFHQLTAARADTSTTEA
ncbi:MAG: ABC transporter ATP-binding protein [Acidobacteriota bacterium]